MEDGRDPRFNNESEAYTQFLRTGFPPPFDITIQAMRDRAEALHKKINEKLIGKFKGKEEEKNVKINNNIEIPITIYTPVDVNKDKLVIFFHGGGWTVNSRKTHQTIVNMLAEYFIIYLFKHVKYRDFSSATKSIWISVEYRLSPEHKFPIWLDDGCEVTRQILANKTAYGADENTKIGVAGDSAGGLIAASICHTIKNLDFQILITSQFDFFHKFPSRQEFNRPLFVIPMDVLDWFSSNALRNDDDKNDPRFSILLNKSFNSLPACLFIVAELDPLRDDSYKYQEILEKAGVKTKLVLIKGVIHPFFSNPGIFIKSCQQVIDAVQEFMKNL
ncbi:unnamed protein product [Rotaria sordida]|uniref:Alpha/beta hydrolase fold-3 domain-containing protein n=1 Tax=Rotaria sordida TaxID=392033 RepID=A0A818W614_9BILA|nr:unnamed protein product [Rotaria sordida]CAF3720247.1 unnamed protein product [Rotaria sordida]